MQISSLNIRNFFKAALKQGWREAEDSIVRLHDLPEHSAQAFEDFHSFLYSGKVYTGDATEVDDPLHDKEWDRLTNSWILGDVLLSVSFKDAVGDAIQHKIKATARVPTGMYEKIYSQSTNSSNVKKLMVDVAVFEWREEHFSFINMDNNEAVHAKFLQDMAIALLKLKGVAKPHNESPFRMKVNCLYHEHGEGKPCYKTLFD